MMREQPRELKTALKIENFPRINIYINYCLINFAICAQLGLI